MNKILKFLPTEKSSVFGVLTLVGMLSMLLMIIIPIPTFVLDILLLINIGMSAIIFLMAVQAKNVLEFSVLPTILIFTTLLRIVLNVSSSRLILGKADGGKVIDAIGNITVGGDYVVGVIMFIVITIVMMLVINKGTSRVAEVSARFILDSLPGKQMSIDGDLNNGVIDMKTAQLRRSELQRETDFYKSMDGASNFIKGDAIAGLVITAVNIIGGLIMGMTRHGMGVAEAASTYTILSVGDGLVNQVPSLLIAAASAFMITKGSSKDGMNTDIMLQLLRYKEPLKIISAIFGVIGLASIFGMARGVPWFVCFVISGGCFYISRLDVSLFESKEDEDDSPIAEVVEEVADNVLHVDKILVHVGTNVATAIVQRDESGKVAIANELKYRIEVLKEKIKKRYGVKIPNIRLTDDDYIPSNSFLVRISNIPTPSLEIKPNCIFASFFGETEIDFGEPAEIRELGLKGYWISKDRADDVESMGAITQSIFDIIIMYLEFIIESNLDKIITREDIKEYKDEVQNYNGAIVEEINQKQIQNSIIQKVVQGLLSEKIPIKNFEYILESIGDYHTEYNGQINYKDLMIFIRKRLSSVITEDIVQNGTINVVSLSMEAMENILRKTKGETDEAIEIACVNIYSEIAATHNQLNETGQKFVFLCDKSIRKSIFDTLSDLGVKINIISYEELPKMARIATIKTI